MASTKEELKWKECSETQLKHSQVVKPPLLLEYVQQTSLRTWLWSQRRNMVDLQALAIGLEIEEEIVFKIAKVEAPCHVFPRSSRRSMVNL